MDRDGTIELIMANDKYYLIFYAKDPRKVPKLERSSFVQVAYDPRSKAWQNEVDQDATMEVVYDR